MTKLTAPQARALNYLANVSTEGWAVRRVHYRGGLVATGPTWDSLLARGFVERRNTLPVTYIVTETGRAALAAYNEGGEQMSPPVEIPQVAQVPTVDPLPYAGVPEAWVRLGGEYLTAAAIAVHAELELRAREAHAVQLAMTRLRDTGDPTMYGDAVERIPSSVVERAIEAQEQARASFRAAEGRARELRRQLDEMSAGKAVLHYEVRL